jgi:hypothetical protein
MTREGKLLFQNIEQNLSVIIIARATTNKTAYVGTAVQSINLAHFYAGIHVHHVHRPKNKVEADDLFG